MMQNIIVQLCALVLITMICVFSFGKQRIAMARTRVFRRLLFVTSACIITDILSVVAIVYAPDIIAFAACKAYLLMILVTSMFMMMYVCYDISELRSKKRFRIGTYIFTGASVAVMLILPLEYHNQDGQIYSFGAAVDFTFIIAPLFIIATFLVTHIFRNRMNPHRRTAVRVWLILQTVGAVIQAFDRHLLLISYGMALGITIIFAKLEIPDENIDRTTGVYRIQLLRDYLNQLFESKTGISCVVITRSRSYEMDSLTEETLMLEVAKFLARVSDHKVFRGIGGDFITVYPNADAAEKAITAVKKRFRHPWVSNIRISPAFLMIPDTMKYSSADEVFAVYQFELGRMDTSAGAVSVLDETALVSFREYREVRAEIVSALSEDRIETFLQPIYSTAEKKFVSAEALVRIKDKQGNYIMPGRFIPAAEQSGLIEQIGDRVFEQVCGIIKKKDIHSLGIEYIEVNLSVVQCENRRLAERYSKKIKENGISPGAINLEITESGAIKHRTVLLENMEKLRDFGCSFSLDDFGTGESNLDYIVNMPVDIVKFDRSMTVAFFTNDRARVMLEAVITMIKRMGLKIVAEGVEEKEQLDVLSELGVDYIQGFYFSKPLPVDWFIDFIRERNYQAQMQTV